MHCTLCMIYAAYKCITKLLGRAFGIGQHHDGITGTHTQAVQEDYVSLVFNSISSLFENQSKFIRIGVKNSNKTIQ